MVCKKHIYNLSLLGLTLVSPVSSAWCMDETTKEDEKEQATAAPAKPTPAQPQQIGMFSHTFDDVITPGTAGVSSVQVSLPYPYCAIAPQRTRLLSPGEVIVVDPATSKFDAYVTFLLPGLFGCVYDPGTGKSLVFHKYATHNMASFVSFFSQFSPTNSKDLKVTLYMCELTESEFSSHKQWYGNVAQGREMNRVRSFLRDKFGIPEANVERRFLQSAKYTDMPKMGQYEETPVTVGASKKGDVFNTSPLTVDFFGFGSEPLPGPLKTKYGAAEKIDELPWDERAKLLRYVRALISGVVRGYYDSTHEKGTYGSASFFSSEEMNVPVASLWKLFNLRFTDTDLECSVPFPKK